MKAHDNAWHLFDYLSTHPDKTGGELPYFSWVRDRGEPVIWANRVYRLASAIPEHILDTLADNIRQGIYPQEVQLRSTEQYESTIKGLLKRGFTALREFPAMSVNSRYQKLPFTFPADWDVQVKTVSNEAQLLDWAGLIGTGFWKDKPDVSEPLFHLYRHFYQANPRMQLYVCYVNGIPAATSMAFISSAGGGIYLVYTREEFRQHSLGALMTQTAILWCQSLGKKTVILQATAMGEPVYKRMGFQLDFQYIILVPSVR